MSGIVSAAASTLFFYMDVCGFYFSTRAQRVDRHDQPNADATRVLRDP